jgi:hypothetical protein
MALGFYFSPTPPLTAQQYDECIKRLKKAGAAHPPGRRYHSCFGTSESVSVFDVWTSQAAFEKFGKILMPIMEAIGANPGQPHVMEIHNIIVPPPAKVKPAARKAAPAKKASARRRAGKKR